MFKNFDVFIQLLGTYFSYSRNYISLHCLVVLKKRGKRNAVYVQVPGLHISRNKYKTHFKNWMIIEDKILSICAHLQFIIKSGA